MNRLQCFGAIATNTIEAMAGNELGWIFTNT
jgi:hypothetical protein